MDRLASILSYGVDKKRLHDKAQEYRERASLMERDDDHDQRRYAGTGQDAR